MLSILTSWMTACDQVNRIYASCTMLADLLFAMLACLLVAMAQIGSRGTLRYQVWQIVFAHLKEVSN